jgi:hypothetical protein
MLDEADAERRSHQVEEIWHKYTVGSGLRQIEFSGVSLRGRSDLTEWNLSTGNALWPCAILLADFIANDWLQLDGFDEWPARPRNVLELGCGLGLVGVVASVVLGRPGTIHLTDRDPKVIARAETMIQHNWQSTDAAVTRSVLEWGNVSDMEQLKLEIGSGALDVIFASDVLYAEKEALQTASLFANTVDALLSKSNYAESNPDLEVIGSRSSTAGKWIPKCYVAFQQRLIDIQLLYQAFSNLGFLHYTPEGEYFEDIFQNRSSERTMFTERFIVCFERCGAQASLP